MGRISEIGFAFDAAIRIVAYLNIPNSTRRILE